MAAAALACLDVGYGAAGAIAACVQFERWEDERPVAETVVRVPAPAPYVPGQLYRRELPGLLAVLAAVPAPLAAVVVDGYVWLDGHGRPGLGAHLHAALGATVAVVGVAKRAFAGAAFAVPVLRGGSRRPLYVTAAGLDPEVAAAHVRAMHGAHRIPTLLARADRLTRR